MHKTLTKKVESLKKTTCLSGAGSNGDGDHGANLARGMAAAIKRLLRARNHKCVAAEDVCKAV